MAAILGLDDAQVVALCQASCSQAKVQLKRRTTMLKGQVVIAGEKAAVEAVDGFSQRKQRQSDCTPSFCTIALFIDEACCRTVRTSFGTNCH